MAHAATHAIHKLPHDREAYALAPFASAEERQKDLPFETWRYSWTVAAWLGQRYLAGFVDCVGPIKGLVLPLLVAVFLTLFITALAAMRHVRAALALQPIEALS